MKLSQLGMSLDIVRDAEFDLLGMATSLFFQDQRVVSFLEDEKYASSLCSNKNIKAVVTTSKIFEKYFLEDERGVVLSEEPKKTFFMLHNELVKKDFYWQKFENRIAASARVDERAMIDHDSVEIGENTVIEAGAIIKRGSIIGNNVIIRSGVIIGGEGFQFSNFGEEMISVRSGGRVIIEDGVEIQYNSCVDKGVLGGDTILRKNVKLDNLVHVGHDVEIGENTIITACSTIAGRTSIGRESWIGPNATLSNGIVIGDHSRISLGAVVTRNIQPGQTVSGNFAIEHQKFIDFIRSVR